jgi:hypothetical protein
VDDAGTTDERDALKHLKSPFALKHLESPFGSTENSDALGVIERLGRRS